MILPTNVHNRFFLFIVLFQDCLSYLLSSLAGMESGIESAEAAGTGCVVCAGDGEVSALSDDELAKRTTALGRQRCRLDAMLAETAAEMHRRSGGRAVSAVMRERLHVSARQATADTALAAPLSEFPSTLDAWRAGEVTAGHARVIARVAGDRPARQLGPAHRAGGPRRRLRALRRTRRGRRTPSHRVVQPGRSHRHRQPRPAVRALPPPRPRRRPATAPRRAATPPTPPASLADPTARNRSRHRTAQPNPANLIPLRRGLP